MTMIPLRVTLWYCRNAYVSKCVLETWIPIEPAHRKNANNGSFSLGNELPLVSKSLNFNESYALYVRSLMAVCISLLTVCWGCNPKRQWLVGVGCNKDHACMHACIPARNRLSLLRTWRTCKSLKYLYVLYIIIAHRSAKLVSIDSLR